MPELARAGIPVRLEVRFANAHNKVVVIDADGDEPVLVTGSFNFTQGAQRKNAENVLVLRGHANSRACTRVTGSGTPTRRCPTEHRWMAARADPDPCPGLRPQGLSMNSNTLTDLKVTDLKATHSMFGKMLDDLIRDAGGPLHLATGGTRRLPGVARCWRAL